jgi:hypothetical protein
MLPYFGQGTSLRPPGTKLVIAAANKCEKGVHSFTAKQREPTRCRASVTHGGGEKDEGPLKAQEFTNESVTLEGY